MSDFNIRFGEYLERVVTVKEIYTVDVVNDKQIYFFPDGSRLYFSEKENKEMQERLKQISDILDGLIENFKQEGEEFV